MAQRLGMVEEAGEKVHMQLWRSCSRTWRPNRLRRNRVGTRKARVEGERGHRVMGLRMRKKIRGQGSRQMTMGVEKQGRRRTGRGRRRRGRSTATGCRRRPRPRPHCFRSLPLRGPSQRGAPPRRWKCQRCRPAERRRRCRPRPRHHGASCLAAPAPWSHRGLAPPPRRGLARLPRRGLAQPPRQGSARARLARGALVGVRRAQGGPQGPLVGGR